MTLQRKAQHRRSRWAVLASVVMTLSLVGGATVLAAHDEVSLAGSNFEIDTDANLKVDDAAPSIDWASVTEIRTAGPPSGAGDDSFGQGHRRKTPPSRRVVDGSIPPNKSDLKFFGVYQEGATSTGFLNLYWSRVQDPPGTTNMDFEFNQSSTLSANGVTPVRTAGDLLIIYDLSNGGNRFRRSSKSTWKRQLRGARRSPSTALNSAGSINTSAIPAGECRRARRPLRADVRRGAAPTRGDLPGSDRLPVVRIGLPEEPLVRLLHLRAEGLHRAGRRSNISNCGSINIHKEDDAGNALAGAVVHPLQGPRAARRRRAASRTRITTARRARRTRQRRLHDQRTSSPATYWVVETDVRLATRRQPTRPSPSPHRHDRRR